MEEIKKIYHKIKNKIKQYEEEDDTMYFLSVAIIVASIIAIAGKVVEVVFTPFTFVIALLIIVVVLLGGKK